MSGYAIKPAENGIYYIHWTEDRRSKRRSTGTKSLAEAKRYLKVWLTEEAAGPKGRLTCADLWDTYYNEFVVPKTRTADRAERIGRNIKAHFGALTPADVDQDTVDTYVQLRTSGKLGKRAVEGTCWLETTKMRASWSYAVKKRAVEASDLPTDIEWPNPSPPRERVLSPAELERMFEIAAQQRGPDGRLSRLERFLWLAAETGARRRAIEGLRWDQVDMAARIIDYQRGHAKTRKRRATVPVSAALWPVLQRMHTERTSDFVLDNDYSIFDRLKACARAAGAPDVSPHTLRHTVATWLAQNDVSLWKIAGVLGNSVAMVEKVYAKHSPSALAEAVDRIRRA